MRWLIVLAVLVFAGWVVYGTVTGAEAQCEVCLEFDGELVCRRGAGKTVEEAERAAQESACGGNAHGMTELIRCRNRTPDRIQCTSG